MTQRGSRAGDIAATALFLGYAIYCAQNFLRCGEAHCAITGPGFFVAAALAALRAIGVSINPELPWIVFVGSYVLGMLVEAALKARTGSRFFKR
jgi:hypothetical protein